jgi:hypothetical protein
MTYSPHFHRKRTKAVYFHATFLEKVAQKAAFHESLATPGFLPPQRLSRSTQGQFLI